MTPTFFVFFVICEFIIIIIYIIIIYFRNSKIHYLSSIELQGVLITSTVKKSEPFNICAWSLSENKYIEYIVNFDKEHNISYTKTNTKVEEKLSRDRYFDVRVGSFVNANYAQPFYSTKFNYCYGRTYIQNNEDDTLSPDHDDSNLNIDRVFITFTRKQGNNIYELDIDKQKLKLINKSAFPENPTNGQLEFWNITRYYEYLNDGNINTVMPNEDKTNINDTNNTLYFEYSEQAGKWKLNVCHPNTAFNGKYCEGESDAADDVYNGFNDETDDDIPETDLIKTKHNRKNITYSDSDQAINKIIKHFPNITHVNRVLYKTINPYKMIKKREDISNYKYTTFNIFDAKTHILHENGKSEYDITINTGYDAINHNFRIIKESSSNNVHTDYSIKRKSIENIKEQSSQLIDRIYHLDDSPHQHVINGQIINNHSPVIIFKNKIYFSNPILFEIIKIVQSKTYEVMRIESFPRMRFIKYFDYNDHYANLNGNIIAIIGIYGAAVIGDILIAKSFFATTLEENIHITRFNEYFDRTYYYECEGDLYHCNIFSYINGNIDDINERYIYLNAFDLYDNFDYNELKKINIT